MASEVFLSDRRSYVISGGTAAPPEGGIRRVTSWLPTTSVGDAGVEIAGGESGAKGSGSLRGARVSSELGNQGTFPVVLDPT